MRNACIKDPKLRDQALRAAKSICLNTAEAPRTMPSIGIVAGLAGVRRSGASGRMRRAAGRTSPADKARVFGIARGEAPKAIPGTGIVAGVASVCRSEAKRRVLEVAAALEIAALAGDCDPNVPEFANPIADRLYSLLTRLSR